VKVLLTGGTGYIGSHSAVALIASGHEVTLVDDFSNSKPAVIERLELITEQPIDFFELDVTDEAGLDDLFTRRSFDAVIHLAAPKAVEESVHRPLHYYRVGVGGTVTLCRIMDRHDIRNLVYSSSATVYGMPDRLPVTEESPLSVINPYGRTKLICEEILEDLHRSDERWNVISLRYFNPVGAHQSGLIGEDPQGTPRNLMPLVAQVAIGSRDMLEVFGDDYPTRDGTPVRDYLHVSDLAEGHVAAVEYLGTRPGYDVFNLGTGSGVTVLELLETFEEASGRQIPRRVVGRRAGDAAELWADCSKADRHLAWHTTRTLHDMCSDTWRWQTMNPRGFEEA